MKKRLAQIVASLLILSMLSTCVYATDVDQTPSEANENVNESNEVSQEQLLELEKPVITSLTASGTAVTVAFNAVENATKYVIAYGKDGNEKQIEVTNNKTTVVDLEYETSYTFKVKAVCSNDENIIESEWSDSKSVITGVVTLRKPTLKLAAYNKGAILSWNKITNATGYEIWRYYNKKWTKIKTVGVKTLKYKNTGLTLNKKYYYRVRAIRVDNGKTRTSEFSNKKSVTSKTYLTSTNIKPGYSSGVLRVDAKKYKEGSSTKTISDSKIKRGTKVTILKKETVGRYKMSYVQLSNGKKYWIKTGNIRHYAPYTTKDYTTEVKENFVNEKGYSSKTKYLLFISHYTQKVYLFKGSKGKWDLQKTYKCATGKATTRTPLGVFKITKKAQRTPLGSRYVSYFKSWNAFHARPYGSKTMSKPASNGCIRMYDDDAIYIYKKIPKETTVVSY